MANGGSGHVATTMTVLGLFLLAGFAGCLGQLNDYVSRPSTAAGPQDGSGAAPESLTVPFGKAVIGSDDVLVGAWLGGWPSSDNDVMASFESSTGVRLDVVDIYMDWSVPFSDARFAVAEIARHGSVPQITWLPNGLTTQDIVEGNGTVSLTSGRTLSIDAYLTAFADGVCEAALGKETPIIVRTLGGPNGDWHSWALGWRSDSGDAPNTPQSYKQAWEKIRSTFDTYCTVGEHVLMVWAINQAQASGPNASYMAAYPGDANVEYVGIDGYNWGDHAPWGWQTFHNLFRQPYCAVSAATSKPLLVTEVASAEAGGNKAEWIRTALRDLSGGKYPQIHGIIWVDDERAEGLAGGTVDWRVGSSRQALAAFTESGQALQAMRGDGSGGVPSVATVTC